MKPKYSAVFLALLLLFTAFPFVTPVFADGENWLTGWGYRKSLTFSGSGSAGTNYQMQIIANYSSGSDSGNTVYLDSKCQTDFDDIRFTDNDGDTLLDYWMEEKTDSDNAVFWVEVADSLSSGESPVIYVYYGNDSVSSLSDGDDTFLFFDDFEDGTLDKWTGDGSHTWTVSDVGGDHDYVAYPPSPGDFFTYIRSDAFSATSEVAVHVFIKKISTYGTYRQPYYVYLADDSANPPDLDDEVDFYNYYDGGTSYRGRMAKYVNSTPEAGPYNIESFSTDWVDWEFQVVPATSKAIADDSTINTANWGDTTSQDYIHLLLGARRAQSQFDRVIVRKFTTTEPSYDSWGSEEEVPVQTFFITFYLNNSTMGDFYVNCTNVANGTTLNYTEGENITLLAVVFANYTLLNFDINGSSNVTSNPYSYNNITGNATLYCSFAAPSGSGSEPDYTPLVYVALAVAVLGFSWYVADSKKWV